MMNQTELLFDGVFNFDAEKIKQALDNGADVESNMNGMTPLFLLLATTQNINIPQTRDCVKILLEHDAQVDKKELEQIVRIGDNFEFYRDNMSEDLLEAAEPALKELYSIFDVEPVPPKRKLEKGEKIAVKSKRWQTQHSELWDLLVPSKGQAKSIQGEVIRISGKISYELLDNGGINWDKDFELMLRELPKLWQKGDFDSQKLDELNAICNEAIEHNGDYCNEEKVSRLSELCVEWILRNPDIMELSEKLPYER